MLCFAAFSQILPLVYIYYLNSSKNIFIVKMFSPKQWYFPGRTSGDFCDADLHFVFILHLSMFFIHIFFSTSSLTLPWIINRFLEPFCTFSPTHRRVICDAFIFQPSRYLLTASATVFEWAFFTHKHFLPYAPSQHLGTTCFIKASLGAGSYSLKFAGLHTDPRNTDPAHLIVWFTVIHNLLYILNLYLYMLILQKFYFWCKLW